MSYARMLVKQVFGIWDLDNDGFVTVKEIYESGFYSQTDIDYFYLLDTNNDGLGSEEEYHVFLMKYLYGEEPEFLVLKANPVKSLLTGDDSLSRLVDDLFN